MLLNERASDTLLLAPLDGSDDRQVASLDLPRGVLEPADRPGRLTRYQAPRNGAEQQHDATQQGEAEDGGVRGVRDGRVALRDPHGPDRATRAQDRDGGGEEVLVQGGAMPDLLGRLPAERGGDLGPRGVVRSDLAGAAAVGDHPARGVGHQHPASLGLR